MSGEGAGFIPPRAFFPPMPKKAAAKKRVKTTKTRATVKPRAAKKPARKSAKKAARTSAKKAKRASTKKAAKKTARAKPQGAAVAPEGRVVVENVNVPGYKTSVDATKYHAMRETLLKVLPRAAPGLTQAEMFDATERAAPQDVFPGGEKAGWWTKCVQLDLEAKGLVKRSAGKPLRWHATG